MNSPADSAAPPIHAFETATRTVARGGWALLIAVGVALTMHGVATYALVALTPGERTSGLLLAGVGLLTLMAAVEGHRHGTRWAWNATWATVAVLAALGTQVLLGGVRNIGGWHLLIAAVALVGQILAAVDVAPRSGSRVADQLRAAYPVGFAYAAGVIGIVGGVQLLGFYLVEFGPVPQGGGPLGSASDLTGALSVPLMIPVVIFLGNRVRRGRAARALQLITIAGVVALTPMGPMLVYGMIGFDIQLVVAIPVVALIFAWIFFTSRWLGRSPEWSAVARFGRTLGLTYVTAVAVIALSFVLSWMSLPQQTVMGIGFVIGGIAFLAVPFWFLVVGHALAMDASGEQFGVPAE